MWLWLNFPSYCNVGVFSCLSKTKLTAFMNPWEKSWFFLLCLFRSASPQPPRYVALLPLGLEHHTLHHSTKLNAMRYVNSTLWLKNYISWTSHVLKSLIDHTLLLPFSLEQAYWKWWFFSAVITQWPCWLVLRLKSRLHFLWCCVCSAGAEAAITTRAVPDTSQVHGSPLSQPRC